MTITAYLVALFLTIILEIIVLLAFAKWQHSLKIRELIPICVCVNLATHPLATMGQSIAGLPLLPTEMVVILLEALAYWRIGEIKPSTAIILAVLTNAVSAITGLAVETVFALAV